MKKIITASILAITASTAAYADTVDRVRIYDHTKTVTTKSPVTTYVCEDVKKPIYGNVQKQGNAAEGALLGMILGGVIGKGVSGNDDGAAAGAVIGGIIGADKGSQPKNSSEIVGYQIVSQCSDRTVYDEVRKDVYSHSTIRFYLNGKRYVVPFQK